MDNVEISNMTISDFELISPVLVSNFDDFWSPEILKSELNNPNSHYIIAKIDDIIVGFAGIWKSIDDVHITDIVVRKDFRKKRYRKFITTKTYRINKKFKL